MQSRTADKINTFLVLTRAYSLPISVMSWLIPFLYAAVSGGNILYGIAALTGIVLLHSASNLFDDIIDYYRELQKIKQGKQTDFNFQKGKCCCIIENKITFKQACIIDFVLFAASAAIGLFFLFIYGVKLLYIIIPAAILCLFYPIAGCFGLGEIILSIIFAPLLYSGVYFVMNGGFSYEVLFLSAASGFITISILINHSLLDYRYDKADRKITLCSISGGGEVSLLILAVTALCGYLSLIAAVFTGFLSVIYLLPLITLPFLYRLIKEMHAYIKTGAGLENNEQFLKKFMLAQNLQISFTAAAALSIILAYRFNI